MRLISTGQFIVGTPRRTQGRQSNETERLVEICSKLNATCYVAGFGAKNYLDEKLFLNSGIKLLYENFIHQTYNQLYGNFIDNLSVVDLLMNEGPRSQQIIRESEQ